MIRCYVTDRHQGDVLACARRAIQNKVDMIQVREKDLDARELFKLVYTIRDFAAGTPTRILVNDRLDVALATGVDGIHLPSNGLPINRVRRFVKHLGVSTHTVEEALDAEKAGADFIIFGPIFDAPGKTPIGLGPLKKVSIAVRIPVLAIGGITAANSAEVVKSGGAGIAGIRLFQSD